MGPAWLRHDRASSTIVLSIHVQPSARHTRAEGEHGGALKVRIGAPAVDGRANAMLVQFLAEALGLPKSTITIRHGAHGRRKQVEIRPASDALVTRVVAVLGAADTAR